MCLLEKLYFYKTLPYTLSQSCRGWVHFSRIGACVPKKNVLKEKPKYFEVIQVKWPKYVFFQHIQSKPILINFKFLDNKEWPIIRKISTRRKDATLFFFATQSLIIACIHHSFNQLWNNYKYNIQVYSSCWLVKIQYYQVR